MLVKELRVRMRGARAYWILSGYLGFLSLVLFFRYMNWWTEAQARGGGLSSGSKIGQDFFMTIAIVQAFLVAFITPAITSGAITIEREQRTMEMLEMTRLPRGSIVLGKLLSAVSFIALLLVSSLPLTSICFFLGGVSPEEVLRVYLLLLVGSFVTGALGLAWSAVARTTSAAVIFTYSTLLLPPFLFILLGYFTSSIWFSGQSSNSLLSGALSFTLFLGLYGINPMEWYSWTPIGSFLQWWEMRHYYGLTLPAWIAPVLSCTLLGVMLAAVAAARLETFPERKALLLRGLVVLFFLQQTFFYLGARFSAYSGAAPLHLGVTMSAYPLIGILSYPALLLLACVPIFSTGEVRPGETRSLTAYLAQGWTLAGWRQGRLASGLPFLWLLAVVVLGMYVLSFIFIGQPGSAASGNVVVSASAVPGPGGRTITPPPAAASSAGSLPKAALVLLASVLGFSALGLLLSTVAGNRWTAMALSYAVLAAILVAPQVAYSHYLHDVDRGPPGLSINLYYLNPLMSLAEMSDTTGNFWNRFPLLFGTTPFWVVTTTCHLMIAGLALLLTIPFAARRAEGAPPPPPAPQVRRITIVRRREV